MVDDRLDRILDATYACFTRHGIRRTTMDDIAAAAEMSRPAVYQHVRNKNDAFLRLAERLFAQALEQSTAAAQGDGSLVDQLHGVLSTKLELTLRLYRDSPHAAELLDAGASLSADLLDAFTDQLRGLLTAAVATAAERGEVTLDGDEAGELADIALALTKGLEGDLADPNLPRRRLRRGLALLVAGLATSPAPPPSRQLPSL